MKDDNRPKSNQSLTSQLTQVGRVLRRYTTLGFVVLLTLVYGFVLVRIQMGQSAEPSSDSVASQLQASATPHVDARIVEQMLNLQDNSVSVRTLFQEARSNPFKE